MNRRIIPCLLLKDDGLYKTLKFSSAKYIGDPINAVKIFNEKFVDEIIILDIAASISRKGPNFALLKEIVSEAFMPVTYGGGIDSLRHVERLFEIGIDKISLNSSAHSKPALVQELVKTFGSQSIVGAVDYKKSLLGGVAVYVNSGKTRTRWKPFEYSLHLEGLGVGEILLNSIDNDGTMNGYDLPMIQRITTRLSIPLTCVGGAGSYSDLKRAFDVNVSGASAGSLFVFKGSRDSILINYPPQEEIIKIIK